MKKSGKFKDVPSLAIVAVCAVALVVTPAYSQVIVYGTELGASGDDIYKIDLATGTASPIFSTGLEPTNSSWPNGNALDAVHNRLYYSTSSDPSKLYFYDFELDTQTLAGELVGLVAGASFYEGKYYYVKNDTDDLYAVSLNADGTVVSVDKKADFASDAKKFYFGDIVITSEGVLYGSAGVRGVSLHEFFKIDLNNGYAYAKIADRHPAVQLAIGSDGALYGHSAGTGEFYMVNRIDGTLTLVGFVTGSKTGKFTDLASGLGYLNIDIKPGSDPNCFNSNGHGVIPVAILGSADFDVSTIDPSTVLLDSQAVRVKGKSGNWGSLEDVNGDGFDDLVVQILDDGIYTPGNTIGVVTAQSYAGVEFRGQDTICITQD